MRLGTRLDPRAEERLRRVSSSGGDEFVSRLTEGPVRTESDRPKADVESLVLDDLVGAAVLGGGVGVGSGGMVELLTPIPSSKRCFCRLTKVG